jgi:hypothetical protein
MGMAWKKDLPEGNETQKIAFRIAPFVSGHGVDLGCGIWPLKVDRTPSYTNGVLVPPTDSCIGIDGGYSLQACQNAHMVSDVSKLPQLANEGFDYV